MQTSRAHASAARLSRTIGVISGNIANSGQNMVLSQMAGRTECDLVVQGIVTESAPLSLMVYVQVFRGATTLTAPPVSFEHAVAKRI
jgi:hypothetical protein